MGPRGGRLGKLRAVTGGDRRRRSGRVWFPLDGGSSGGEEGADFPSGEFRVFEEGSADIPAEGIVCGKIGEEQDFAAEGGRGVVGDVDPAGGIGGEFGHDVELVHDKVSLWLMLVVFRVRPVRKGSTPEPRHIFWRWRVF